MSFLFRECSVEGTRKSGGLESPCKSDIFDQAYWAKWSHCTDGRAV